MKPGLRALGADGGRAVLAAGALGGLYQALLLTVSATSGFIRICGGVHDIQAISTTLRIDGLLPLAGFWLLMLLCMTAPLLPQHLLHLFQQTLRSRRNRAVALFAIGYFGPWMAAVGLLWIASAFLFLATRNDISALVMAVGIGLIWTGTPARAIAVGQCHQAPPLATFGLRAELASLGYGGRTAWWCIRACWPWMLIPLTQPQWHIGLMVPTFLIMLNERYARPPLIRPLQ